MQVAGDTYSFLMDTGIGLTVVSSRLADRPDVVLTGESFAGRRMSGQVVEARLVRLPVLQLGDLRVENHVAGVFDLGEGFDGIPGPGFFEGYATTVDPTSLTITVEPASAARTDGSVVPVEVERGRPVDRAVHVSRPPQWANDPG